MLSQVQGLRQVAHVCQSVLPFGSVSSVYALNKSARALQHLLLGDFNRHQTNFFNNFPALEFESAGDMTMELHPTSFS